MVADECLSCGKKDILFTPVPGRRDLLPASNCRNIGRQDK